MATDACLIDDLCKIARRALEPFTLDEPYALVDFPTHANVGDSAIWAGDFSRSTSISSAAWSRKSGWVKVAVVGGVS